MNRRDLLKIFGAGTVIAPAVGASPLARLIEPAKVELALPPQIVEPIDLHSVKRLMVSLEMMDGTQRSIDAEVIDFRGYGQRYVVPERIELRFFHEHTFSPEASVVIASIEGVCAVPSGRCPYCQSKLVGNRCKSCGASA